MNNINLLDCTLRDGGYINDWKFGYHTIRDIIEKLVEAQTDFVEVGFLRNDVYDPDRAVFNNLEQIAGLLPPVEKRGNTHFTVMALHNKYDFSQLEPYDGKTVDLMRITFHDYDIEEGFEHIKIAMDKGYKVSVNPINIMGYSDADLLNLLTKVNELHPFAFALVDTFGSMMKEDLLRIYSLVEHNLDPSIAIGLHLHENLGLAYSLAQDFLEIKKNGRQCIIDGSMLGMGRVPGNLCLELIMDYMNRTRAAGYNTNPVLDGIDDYIIPIKEHDPWGYTTAYALSAKYNLHRNYAEYYIGKGNLRAKQINQLLAFIPENKKSAFDEDFANDLYQSFQSNAVDDSAQLASLKSAVEGREILVLAPGSSIMSHQSEIEAYIRDQKPLVLAANFIPENYQADYVFFSNARRYQNEDQKGERAPQFIVTSNLLDVCDGGDLVVNYSELSFDEKGSCDNSVIMLLKLLGRLGITRAAIAGFDGYQPGGQNYANSYMASHHTKGQEVNDRLRAYVSALQTRISLDFLTPSLYL